MKKITVNLNNRSYDIFMGSGAIARLPRVIKSMNVKGPIVVITDETVKSKTASVTKKIFLDISNTLIRIVVPATEKSKSLKVFQNIINTISKKTKTHRPLVIALGGGVVGDLTGFVAATYRRGVSLIQIPTTLLAQVDSSVGGKVGVDMSEAKNLIGAFHQPKAVLMDTDFLRTLPQRQIRNGLAEIIKYAIIGDPNLFKFLEGNVDNILKLKKNSLEKVLQGCVAVKARVVEKDEFDTKDIRISLNFGHTLGHAIEAASGYGELYNHGESVALGMILAGEIAMRLEMLKEKDFNRIKNLIKKAGLPVNVQGISVKEIVNSYGYDKKFVFGSNRFVLPKKIGYVEVIDDIPEILIRTVLREYVK